MSEAIRRLNQFDVLLERMEHGPVRDGFAAMIDLIRSMQADGMHTAGTMYAKEISLNYDRVKSKEGRFYAEDLELGNNGWFRTICYQDDLAGGANAELVAPKGKVWGYVGWTESTDTSGGSGNTNWYPLEWNLRTDRNYLRPDVNNENEDDKIHIENGTGSSLQYRIIIFYRENEQ